MKFDPGSGTVVKNTLLLWEKKVSYRNGSEELSELLALMPNSYSTSGDRWSAGVQGSQHVSLSGISSLGSSSRSGPSTKTSKTPVTRPPV
jgi:hypothetical protein